MPDAQADLLRLLEMAHPGRPQADLLAMIEATPDAPTKAAGKPVQRRVGSRPRSSASMERRRSWAASGRLPPRLAARFTLAEQAVLSLVAAEIQKRGACALTVDHIAALAGVGPSSVRNAIREAKALGLVTVEEKRRTAWMSYPNTIRIVSPEWGAWLRLHGFKSVNPTTKDSRKQETSRSTPKGFGFRQGRGAGRLGPDGNPGRRPWTPTRTSRSNS